MPGDRNYRQPPRPVAPPKPQFSHLDARRLFDSISASDVCGLRDRALISLVFHNHLRPSDALGLLCSDFTEQGVRDRLQVCAKKVTKTRYFRQPRFTLPLVPEAEEAVSAYMKTAGMTSDSRGPLFRSVDQHTGFVIPKRLSATEANASIQRRIVTAGFRRTVSLHHFRVAGLRLLPDQSEIYGF